MRMSSKIARITYLYNSGFSVETENQLLIFDYCLMNSAKEQKRLTTGVVGKEDLMSKPSVTVFASHGHKDHFNAAVLRWRVRHKNIIYIFSDDIPANKEAILMKSGDSVTLQGMRVSAFPSTDIGVSFLVETEGLAIFHAGDLNLWSPRPSTEEASLTFKKAKFAYLKVLKHIYCHTIDIAFFPVDPRIGPGYETGALYFAQYFKPRLFVPMHFGNNYDACQVFSAKNNFPGMEVFRIQMRGQQYEYCRENA